MGKYAFQMQGSDGCVWVYDLETRRVKRVCEITSSEDIPADVWTMLKMAKFEVVMGDRKNNESA